MVNIERFVCNDIRENCYVVSDDSKECLIVDCGAYYEAEKKALQQYIEKNQLTPTRLISTHGHVDHHLGDRFVYDTWGIRPEVPAADEPFIQQLPQQAAALMGLRLTQEDFAPVGCYLKADDRISFGNHTFSIIETPGHSPGSVFFYCEQENIAFSGDTLFQGSVGRTDFQGGSMFMLIQSLRHISQLPDNTEIFPGHGEMTTIGLEETSNPYLDR